MASLPVGATHSAWALSSSTQITTRLGADGSPPPDTTRSNTRVTTSLGAVKLGVAPVSDPTEGPDTWVQVYVSVPLAGVVALPCSVTSSARVTS